MADFKAIETQEEFDKMIQKRLEQKEREVSERFKDYLSPDEVAKIKNEYDGKIKSANDSLKAERDKSIEHSKIVSELEARAKTAETRYLKGKIANEKGIPYALADRLIGDTEEELLKDAESVSALLAPRNAPPLFTNDTNHGQPGTPNATDAAFAQLLSGLTQQS